MSYSSGKMDMRVGILNRDADTEGQFGRNSGGISYSLAATVRAWVDWDKGLRALREGAMEAYEVIMVRMRYNCIVNRDSRIQWNGRTYQIMSLHADYRQNTIQITAQEIVS